MTVTVASASTAKSLAKHPRKMTREPKLETASQGVAPDPAKRANKTDLVLGLLQRPEGVTIDQLVASTGWLPHTTRAALSGLKKKGHVIFSEKVLGLRHYRIINGAA